MRGGGSVDGAEQHFFATSAAGEQADADFDQAGVEFGVGLAGCGVQGNFRAATQAQAERRGYHGFRGELDGLGHALELADDEINIVPLFFLHAHEQEHEVGTDGKIRGVVGDDEGVEVIAWAAGFQGLTNKLEDVGAQRVHLAVELDAGYAVADVDDGSAGVFLDDSLGFFCDGHGPDSRWDFDWFPVSSFELPVFAA